jgi:hypothetical protein
MHGTRHVALQRCTLGKMIYYNDKKESKPSCGKGLEVQQPTNYIKGNGRKW